MSKVVVSLPSDLLAAIDAEVRRRGTTRSGLLADAARRELARPAQLVLLEAVERSRQRFASSGAFAAGDLIRAERDAGGDSPGGGRRQAWANGTGSRCTTRRGLRRQPPSTSPW